MKVPTASRALQRANKLVYGIYCAVDTADTSLDQLSLLTLEVDHSYVNQAQSTMALSISRIYPVVNDRMPANIVTPIWWGLIESVAQNTRGMGHCRIEKDINAFIQPLLLEVQHRIF
jgi:hypothetical protein